MTASRRTLAPALLALLTLGACAEAQRAEAPPPAVQQPAVQQAARGSSAGPSAAPARGNGPRRIPKTLNEPLGMAQPATAGARPQDRAPVPDRDIEAPRDRFANYLAPKLEPMVLQPERRQGLTFGREHLRDTGPDKPFDTLLPGARLRIPFE